MSIERGQTMSEINTLVDRYVAVWNEPNAELRRKSITKLWVEDGVQFIRSREIRGYKALEERVEAVHEEFVKTGGFVFRLSSDTTMPCSSLGRCSQLVAARWRRSAPTSFF
jgi:hypothetical protein